MTQSGRKQATRGSIYALLALTLSLGFASCENPAAEEPVKSTNAKLSAIAINASGTNIPITPSFSADTFVYEANAANTVETVTVIATAADTTAAVTGSGEKTLEVGENTVELKVTAADGTTQKTYTLTINRAQEQASNDATIATITVGNTVFQAPAANASLSAEVACTATTATISATPTDSGAAVTITGNENFAYGDNTVTITVTAEDGLETKDYTVHVIRHGLTIANPPEANSITTPAFTLQGSYYGIEPPAISIKFAGLDKVNATIDSAAKTWSATIDGSSVANGEGKTLNVTAAWGESDSYSYTGTYTFAGSTVSTARAVFVTSPIKRETVSTQTIRVAGCYAGEGTPESITVGLGSTSTPAIINAATHTWTAEVTPAGVAKTDDVNIRVTAVWSSTSSATAFCNFAYEGTQDTGHTVSGTITFPWKDLTSDTMLYVYTIDPTIDASISSYNTELTSATTYEYTLNNVADGTYSICAYTHAGDWAFVSGTSCYQWRVISITVNGSDIVDQDFKIKSPAGFLDPTYNAHGKITIPAEATFASTSCIAVLLYSTSVTPNEKIGSINIPITDAREYVYSFPAPSGSYRIESYVNNGDWVYGSAEDVYNWDPERFDIIDADKEVNFQLDNHTRSITIATPAANSSVSGNDIQISGSYTGFYIPTITYLLKDTRGVNVLSEGTATVFASSKTWSATIDSSSFTTGTPVLSVTAEWESSKKASTYENFNFSVSE